VEGKENQTYKAKRKTICSETGEEATYKSEKAFYRGKGGEDKSTAIIRGELMMEKPGSTPKKEKEQRPLVSTHGGRSSSDEVRRMTHERAFSLAGMPAEGGKQKKVLKRKQETHSPREKRKGRKKESLVAATFVLSQEHKGGRKRLK